MRSLNTKKRWSGKGLRKLRKKYQSMNNKEAEKEIAPMAVLELLKKEFSEQEINDKIVKPLEENKIK